MASVSSEPVSTLPPLVLEAQRLMTLSVNKIVASRSRKGGVSLHRNLLVAGVLFRARDALLAAGGKMMSQSSPSTASPASSGTSPSSEAKQQQPQNPGTTSNDTCRTSSIPSSPPSSDSPTPTTETCVLSVSVAAETKPCPHREVPVDTDDCQMDIEIMGKENVPPTATSPSSTSEFSKLSSSETEPMMMCDKPAPSQQGAPVSRKRNHSGSSTSCPIVEKSSKVVLSSESDDGRASSVPVCVGLSSSKNVTSSSSRQSSPSSQSCSSSSLNSRSSISVNNPVVYVNRVDLAFCSTSGIGGGVIRPVLVVQVV